MKPVEADMYLGRLSEETGISEEAIRREYESGKDNQNQSAFAAIIGREQSAEDEISEAEQELLKLMLIDSDFVKLPDDIAGDVFQDRISSSIYTAIKAVDKGERPLDMSRITDQIDIECSQMLSAITSKVIAGDRERDIYEDCIRFIRTRKLIREADRITARLRDPDIDRQEAEKLMQRQIEIQRSIKG
jgi:hypothetical protein